VGGRSVGGGRRGGGGGRIENRPLKVKGRGGFFGNPCKDAEARRSKANEHRNFPSSSKEAGTMKGMGKKGERKGKNPVGGIV